MSKAVITPLCILFFALTAPQLPAQPVPTDVAIQEAVRRQAGRIELREKLVNARAAAQRKDFVTAAKLYSEAWTLVQSIGLTPTDPEVNETIAGFTQVRMELARLARNRGDLIDAQHQVEQVLFVNPRDPAALALSDEIKRLAQAQQGKVPSVDLQQQVPIIESNRIAAATLVQNGRLLYELGQYDAADVQLKQALRVDPSNPNAVYYAKLVEQGRASIALGRKSIDDQKKLVMIEQAWEEPVIRETLPIPNPMARTNTIYTGRGRQSILSKLDRIRLDNVLYDGLPLAEVVRSLSEEVKRRDPERRGINILINPNQETVAATPVTISTGFGAPAGAVPGRLPGVPTGVPGGIDPATGLPIGAPTTPAETIDINNGVTIKINPALTDVRLADVLDAIVTVSDRPIRYSILDYAIVFSLKGPETPELHFRTFKVDPNTFVQGLQSVGALDFSTLIQSSSGGGGGGGGLGGGGGGGGQGGGGAGGQQGGGAMTVPRVQVASGTTGGGGGGGIGGGGGGGIGGGGGGGGQGGAGLLYVTGTNSMAIVQDAVVSFFASVGVDLSPGNGKNVFFNDREGTLMVRATTQELDIIEAAIQTLNIAPPQINVKAKFVEVTQNDSRQLGFDWYLGNFLMANSSIGMQGGTAPTYPGRSSQANPGGSFPGGAGTDVGGAPYNTAFPHSFSDELLTGGLRNSGAGNIPGIPAIASLTGILTDPQFRVVLRALEQRDGADLLNEGQVTTMSGRQAQIQVVDLQTIVTGTGVNAATGGAVAGATGANITTTPQQAITPTTSVIPLGPTLDVIPYVSADGYTIQMTLIPTVIEFLGYDDPGNFIIQAQIGQGLPLTAQLPLPHFRVRQVTTSAIVWDGQTIVLGGLISENIGRIKDKVPVLGDLPLFGRLFRSESNVSLKKNLVIFVTPTIIDPAGNRVHNDADLPFAQSVIPRPDVVTP